MVIYESDLSTVVSEVIQLPLRARHFEGTEFGDCENCSISKGYKDLTGEKNVSEGAVSLNVYDKRFTLIKRFKHRLYDAYDFAEDRLKAIAHNYDDTIIRTIELTPVK